MTINRTLKAYIPMTETAFYILLSLGIPKHGYGIIKFVEGLTQGRIKLGSGTVYGTLTKMQKDGLISVYGDEQRRTVYMITPVGKEVMQAECVRVKKLHTDMLSQEGYFNA